MISVREVHDEIFNEVSSKEEGRKITFAPTSGGRPLVVGQAPSKSHGRRRAFDGPSGKRLAKCLDMTLPEFLDAFDTANMLQRWPGKHRGKFAYREKGDRFPIVPARRRVRVLTQRAECIVLCGARVAAAWGLQRLPFFVWAPYFDGFGRLVVVVNIPHPSGCNLLWNKSGVKEASTMILRQALRFASR